MRPRRLVLLVDGDGDRRLARTAVMETRLHVRVVGCTSAEEALAGLRRGARYDVLVVQESLSGQMDGPALCDQGAAIDPAMMELLLLDREDVPNCAAHRLLRKSARSVELLEGIWEMARRRRGPKRTAAARAARAMAEAV